MEIPWQFSTDYENNIIDLVDTHSWQSRGIVDYLDDYKIRAVAFSPDGTLATAGIDGAITFWDISAYDTPMAAVEQTSQDPTEGPADGSKRNHFYLRPQVEDSYWCSLDHSLTFLKVILHPELIEIFSGSAASCNGVSAASVRRNGFLSRSWSSRPHGSRWRKSWPAAIPPGCPGRLVAIGRFLFAAQASRRRSSGRSPGGQPGHEGHGRSWVPVEQVDERIPVKPST